MGCGMTLQSPREKAGVYLYLSEQRESDIGRCVFSRAGRKDDLAIAHHHSPVIQADDYYPFGMVSGSTRSDVRGMKNDYLYNGKELQTDLNLDWYDYGARMPARPKSRLQRDAGGYDAGLGRFHSTDPISENYYNRSPYVYAANNPILYIDVNGMGEGFFERLWSGIKDIGKGWSELPGATWEGFL